LKVASLELERIAATAVDLSPRGSVFGPGGEINHQSSTRLGERRAVPLIYMTIQDLGGISKDLGWFKLIIDSSAPFRFSRTST
jgi:hypothetical protein